MLKLCHKIPKEATNTNSFDENRVNKTGWGYNNNNNNKTTG
jgi:hypothetical protein